MLGESDIFRVGKIPGVKLYRCDRGAGNFGACRMLFFQVLLATVDRQLADQPGKRDAIEGEGPEDVYKRQGPVYGPVCVPAPGIP